MKDCCCKHPDARACLQIRHPEICRRSDDVGGMYDEFFDEVCDCHCHREIEEEERERDAAWREEYYGPAA